MGNFIPAEGQMSRGADESSRELDKMLAAAQFNGNPLNALVDGGGETSPPSPVFEAKDVTPKGELKTDTKIVGGPSDGRGPLDWKAYEFLRRLGKLISKTSAVNSRGEKPEFGGDIYVITNPNTGNVRYEFNDHQEGSSGSEVEMLAHPTDVIAMLHTHTPIAKGKWGETDAENRRISDFDISRMKQLVSDIQRNVQTYNLDRDNFDIYAYLATPDGQIRRFDPENEWGGDGVLLWPSGTVWYYDDIAPYDPETLKKYGKTP